MNSRTRRIYRRTKILSIIFLFFLIFTYVFFKPEADPCFNGVQDGMEEGIDCGGLCDLACSTKIRGDYSENVIINWSDFTEDGTQNYDFAASVLNKNLDAGSALIKYKFIVYGSSGDVLREVSGRSYLMPGAKDENSNEDIESLIVENNVYISQRPKRVDFEIYEYDWDEIKEEDLNQLKQGTIRVLNTNLWFDNERNTYAVYGETRNRSKYSFNKIDIGVVLLDQNNEILAISKTDQLTMKSGEGWGFEVLWPNLEIEEDTTTKLLIRASTNVLDKNNYISDYTAVEN